MQARPSPAQEGVSVPPAAWYALVYAPTTDTLHWLTPQGQLLAMPRPKLPNEADFGFPEMHLSADGKRLLISRPTPNNTFELGFYDVENGVMLRVHESQPDEIPYVFSRYASDPNGQAVAVGLANGITAQERAWRVIIFDFQTGDVLAQLTSADAALQALEDGATLGTASVFPQVIWVESGIGTAANWHIRFDPIRLDEVEQPSQAIIWNPSGLGGDPTVTVAPSPYNAKAIDFIYGKRDAAFAYYNGALPDPEVPFIRANAIGRGSPQAREGYPPPSLLFGTGADAYDRVVWAGDQRGVVFRGNQADGGFRWYMLDFNSGQAEPLPPNTLDAISIPSGFLFIADGTVYSRAVPITGTGDLPIWENNDPAAPLMFVWATPIGALNNFALNTIFAPEGSDTTPQSIGTRHCDKGLPSRVDVGDRVELLIPYGFFFTEDTAILPSSDVFVRLNAATAMTIIGGPICVNDFTYWQVQLDDARRGWTVESGETDYILGLEGSAAIVPADPSGQSPTDPNVGQNATIITGPTALDNCPKSLDSLLNVGAQAQTTILAAMYEADDPNAIGRAEVYRGVPPDQSVTVAGGPVCANGYVYWIVDWRDAAGAFHRGWIAESIESGYILRLPDADVPTPASSTVIVTTPTPPPTATPEPTPEVTPPVEEVVHCEGAPPSRVVEGLRVRVETVDNIPVFIRDAPGGTQIDLVNAGTELTIIEGPACAEGNPFTYWRIRTDDGAIEGWMAEGDAISYFITPILSGE